MATHTNDRHDPAFDPNGPYDGAGSILSTVGGPSDPNPPESLGADTPESERLLEKVGENAELAGGRRYNATKGLEYGLAAYAPHRGEVVHPDTPLATASTTTEDIASRKVGDGQPDIGDNPLNRPLDRVRVDDGKRELTNQGVKVPSVMYDAVVVAPGEASATALARDGRALEFVRDAYRHDKPFLVLGAGRRLLAAAGIPAALPGGEPDPGLVVADPAGLAAALAAFRRAVAGHRVYVRETETPRV